MNEETFEESEELEEDIESELRLMEWLADGPDMNEEGDK